MEATAVRTIDRLLALVSRKESVSREESQQVPEETPPKSSPEEDSAPRPRHLAPCTPSPRR
eukprot:15992114-Heterocapsa_arctica.AAC.1